MLLETRAACRVATACQQPSKMLTDFEWWMSTLGRIYNLTGYDTPGIAKQLCDIGARATAHGRIADEAKGCESCENT